VNTSRKFLLRLVWSGIFFSFLLSFLNAQSIFSFKGEGESVLVGDAQMSSLGFSGVPGTVSSNNYGSIAFLQKTGIAITYSGIRLEMRDESGKNIMHYYGIPFINVATTLPRGFAIGFNLKKVIDFNADFVTNPDTIGGNQYIEQFSKRGQLSTVSFNLAKRMGSVGFGGGFNVLFGGSDEMWITNFSDTLFRDTRDSLNSTFFGHSYSLGVVFSYDILKIDFGYDFPVSCKRTTRSLSYLRKDTVEVNNNLEYPQLFTGNLNLQLGQDLRFAFATRYRPWENFEIDEEKDDSYLNTFAYSVGMEYNLIRAYKKWKFPLRIGYYSKPWYFKDSYNKKVSENGFTCGTSIPFLKKDGYLDLAFIYGVRNTSELKEHFYNFRIGFNFYERW
jgi:hypothetical protein